MTSPLAGATLTAQRAQLRWKTYHIAISVPNSIFAARINQATWASIDNVSQFPYDGGTGTAANVKPGMSCYVGSAAGLSDIGIVRVRKSLTSTLVFIGKTSGVQFADNLYLTFVDDFGLYAKEPVKTDTAELVDTDMEFSPALSFAPIVRVGPAAVVLELTGATVTYTHPGLTMYSVLGATAGSWVSACPGASATSNLTTSTPSFTFNAVGESYISYSVTDSLGIVGTRYQKVFVRSTTDAVISPPEISGDVDACGFSARIEGYSGVGVSALRDRALCVIWRKDYTGTARATSYGPYAGATAVRFVGWLNGETLSIDPVTGSASFTIDGPAAWLDKLAGFPCYRQDGTATAWHHIASMTTDFALYSLIKWQSTLADICDVSFTGDTTPIYTANINSDSLLSQINSLAGEKLNARICFDEYGCGFITTPPSLRTSSGKSANTVLWDMASSDWTEKLDIERNTVDKTAMLEIGGTSWDGTTEIELFSRAWAAEHGAQDAPTSTLALASQAVCNQLAGDMLALANSEYPSVGCKLFWPNDYAGFAMAQGWLVRLSLATGDTPRGISWTNKRFAIEAVSFDYDADKGAESTGLELAEETTGTAGFTYIPPVEIDDNGFGPAGPPGFDDPGFGTWQPPFIEPGPTDDGACPSDSPANAFILAWDRPVLVGTDAILSSYAYFPCAIRPASYTNGPTVISIDASFTGDMQYTPLSFLACYAIDASKNRILTGTVYADEAQPFSRQTITLTFSPVSLTQCAGFELVLTAGGDNPGSAGGVALTYNAASVGHTEIVNSGSVVVNSLTATQVATDLIRIDFDVTNTVTNGLLSNQVNLSVRYTANAHDIYGTFYPSAEFPQFYIFDPPAGSGILYPYPNPIVNKYLFTWGSFSNNYGFKLGLIQGVVGIHHLAGSIYASSGAITAPNVRRIIINSSVIADICAVTP